MDSESEQLELFENLNFLKELVPDDKKTKIKIGDEEIVVDNHKKKSIQQLDAQVYFEKTNNTSKESPVQEYFDDNQINEKEEKPKYRRLPPKEIGEEKGSGKEFDVYNAKTKKNFSKKKLHLNLQDNYTKASPEQIFYFCGVKISVIYASFLKASAHTLVIPFRAESEWVGIFESKNIADKMKQNLNQSDYAKNKKFHLIKTDNIFYNKNYQWTMLYKCDLGKYKENKPSTLLRDYFKDILEEAIKYNMESIVVPRFRWCQSLPNLEKAKVIFDLLLSYLRGVTNFGPCPIKELSFCLNEVDEYFCFLEAARKISDEIVRNGGVAP